MPPAGAIWRCIWIETGSRSISLASAAIGGGIVALKSNVCRLAGRNPGCVGSRQEAHVEHPVGFVEHQVLDLVSLA